MKNVLIKKCSNHIKKNEKLIVSNINKSTKTDNSFRETFNKVFTKKDVELEKELMKDHISNMKKAGEFIYGEEAGFFTNNQKRIFQGY